jgi:hypothetical protein
MIAFLESDTLIFIFLYLYSCLIVANKIKILKSVLFEHFHFKSENKKPHIFGCLIEHIFIHLVYYVYYQIK